MSGEIAIYDILSKNVTYRTHVGTTEANCRIFYEEAPQKAVYPHCIISQQSITTNETKSGPSGLDFDYIRLLHIADTKKKSRQMALDARTILEASIGTFNTIEVVGIVFQDQDSFLETIVDRSLVTTEQIYKVMEVR